MNQVLKNLSTHRRPGLGAPRVAIWLGMAVMLGMGAWHLLQTPVIYAAGPACERGQLVARPDVAGVYASGPQLVIQVLDNDGAVPHGKPTKPDSPLAGPAGVHAAARPADSAPDSAADPATGGSNLSLTGMTAAAHGSVGWASDGKSVVYTPNGQFVGSDHFTYTIQDECGRTATGKVVIVVFAADLPATPGLIVGPPATAESNNIQVLPLPFGATLKIPAELFGQVNGEGGAHYFAFLDAENRTDTPRPGLRFANVAFRLAQFLDTQPVENPVFPIPLILEVAFDATQFQDESGATIEPELYYWNETDQRWQRDGIVRLGYDPNTGVAVFAIYHLTEFALFAGTPPQPSLFAPLLLGE
ncbi:MAG: Ig-like domain-containing protein [Litorilinea sp.]